MLINPYLNFNGDTEKAFRFYQSVFGGEFSSLQRFKDMPSTERLMPKDEGERIMHIALPIGKGNLLMGSDISEEMSLKLTPGNNVCLSLHPDTKEGAERLYKGLSAGGSIEMQFQKMFWGAYYGSFTDRFGIKWMINVEAKKK